MDSCCWWSTLVGQTSPVRSCSPSQGAVSGTVSSLRAGSVQPAHPLQMLTSHLRVCGSRKHLTPKWLIQYKCLRIFSLIFWTEDILFSYNRTAFWMTKRVCKTAWTLESICSMWGRPSTWTNCSDCLWHLGNAVKPSHSGTGLWEAKH